MHSVRERFAADNIQITDRVSMELLLLLAMAIMWVTDTHSDSSPFVMGLCCWTVAQYSTNPSHLSFRLGSSQPWLSKTRISVVSEDGGVPV